MIRAYQHSDKSALLDLISVNTPTYFAPEEKADYSSYLENELEEYFVFEKNGKAIGAGGINYFPEEKLARLSWDMVDAKAQGQGIGGQLVNFRINKIKENKALTKIVVRTSQLAANFYQKMGFTLVRKEVDYWAKGLDLYYMEMAIA